MLTPLQSTTTIRLSSEARAKLVTILNTLDADFIPWDPIHPPPPYEGKELRTSILPKKPWKRESTPDIRADAPYYEGVLELVAMTIHSDIFTYEDVDISHAMCCYTSPTQCFIRWVLETIPESQSMILTVMKHGIFIDNDSDPTQPVDMTL